MARILLGVTGGIASYKSVWLARLLTQAGHEVDVVMSRAAREFVGAITFEAVTGRPVHTQLLDAGHALDHIKLARAADALVVAPATAEVLAKAAGGHADDLLTACLLAATCPVLVVPAMNDRMWAHPQVAQNVAHLRALGYAILEPAVGPLAQGEGSGAGRLPEPEVIAARVARLVAPASALRGRHVVVTAGPTREAVDPVRFVCNNPPGTLGGAFAAAAWRRGAEVTLIAGPMSAPVGAWLPVVPVETTQEMADAVRAALPRADVLVMAAAPADFRPVEPAAQKIKKGAAPRPIELTPTPDILLTTRADRRPGSVIVGFALETTDVLASARRKLEVKSLDLVVANDATEPGAGFGHDTNRVTLVTAEGEVALPLLAKPAVAEAILDEVEARLARQGAS
ncbi:MAG: bifunctional phosphopantothenoylcysteine decarboxylase/phosphopantothenate--cysteine ligase CoaBC [Gemmatimonadota bacterium]